MRREMEEVTMIIRIQKGSGKYERENGEGRVESKNGYHTLIIHGSIGEGMVLSLRTYLTHYSLLLYYYDMYLTTLVTLVIGSICT